MQHHWHTVPALCHKFPSVQFPFHPMPVDHLPNEHLYGTKFNCDSLPVSLLTLVHHPNPDFLQVQVAPLGTSRKGAQKQERSVQPGIKIKNTRKCHDPPEFSTVLVQCSSTPHTPQHALLIKGGRREAQYAKSTISRTSFSSQIATKLSKQAETQMPQGKYNTLAGSNASSKKWKGRAQEICNIPKRCGKQLGNSGRRKKHPP